MNRFGEVFVFSLLLSVAVCIPIEPELAQEEESRLVNYESVQGREMYRLKYETSDGQFREEVGMLINIGTPEQELMLMGQYGFKSKDGSMVMVMYTSGKKGYRARTVTRGLRKADLMNKVFQSLLMG